MQRKHRTDTPLFVHPPICFLSDSQHPSSLAQKELHLHGNAKSRLDAAANGALAKAMLRRSEDRHGAVAKKRKLL